MIDATRIAEANRLYWDTNTSVADIAEQFDVSRRALYDAVRPHPAGLDCPTCGQGLQYENRSARRDRQATCPECGVRIPVADTADAEPEAMKDPAPAPDQDLRADARTDDAVGDSRDNDLRGRAVLLGSAAIAGVAIGTVAALLARRRD
jgi:DNA-directed RNA polymerase subunit RPC12/RpoP